MPEDDSKLNSMRAANAPDMFDLHCVGAHSGFGYPLDWLHGLKTRNALGKCFAGKLIPLVRGDKGDAFSAVRGLRAVLAGSRVPMDADPVLRFRSWAAG